MAAGAVVCNLTNSLPKRCAVFDGVNDQIGYVLNDYEYKNSFSLGFWLYMDISDATYRNILQSNWNSQGTFVVWNRNGGVSFEVKDETNSSVPISSTIPTKTWVHLLISYDGTNINFYKNGVAETPVAVTNGFIPNSSVFYSPKSSSSFIGKLFDMRFFNKALTDAEALKLSQGLNVTDGLIHRWKLDKDYKDSVGSNDGTNSGSYLTTVDDQVATAISDARTTANDHYLMAVVNNKVMTSVIEEAP